MKSLLAKGNFQKIDEVFLTDSLVTLQEVSKIQVEYNKLDTDTFINEIHDSMVAKYLDYTHVNIEKHGFDARRSSLSPEYEFDYLEVKAASFAAKSWQATFNDTNLEKAASFQQNNVYLALSVWRAAAELLFIVYGQNKNIGIFLEEKVKHFKTGAIVRSTQSISISDLVNKYGFKIYTVSKSCEEIYSLFQLRNGCKKIPQEAIFPIKTLPHLSR